MKRSLFAAVLTVAVVASSAGPVGALPRGTKVVTYQSGLAFPVDMAWVPGTSKIFFTEKSGRVRVMNEGRLLSEPCVTLDVNSQGESGALGIVLHPNFKETRKLYVFYTNMLPLENRVTSFIVVNNRCTAPDHIVTGLRASSGYHNGGQLEFMGGKLFVSTGEEHDPGEAQDRSSRLGKILRYNDDGSIPTGNPFGDNPVWSYGHRNPFGLAHKPGTAKLYSSENGPSCDDELNIIRPGRNYGWGAGYECGDPVGNNPKPPLKSWTPPIVPTDLWWYSGRLKAMSGSLYMGDYGDGALHRFVMNRKANRVKEDRIVHRAGDGIVDVSKGPGRWLYFLTRDSIMRIVRS